jgi:hypothetical protein
MIALVHAHARTLSNGVPVGRHLKTVTIIIMNIPEKMLHVWACSRSWADPRAG